jgi:hypothetical protein
LNWTRSRPASDLLVAARNQLVAGREAITTGTMVLAAGRIQQKP